MTERRLSCCLTFDFDALSIWITTFGARSPSALSRGEFGAVAVPRILEILARRSIRATFCVPGHTALAYPELVRRIRDEGHELAHHGFIHENPQALDERAEREALERGLEALDSVAGVRPAGYRSPGFELSQRSVELLLEYRFSYDSSCMGDDFAPYWLRTGDVVSPTSPFVFGQKTQLLELPVTWGLDDWPVFEPVWSHNPGLAAPSLVEQIWVGDFEWALSNRPGGIFTLTLHPQVIGRGHRLLLLERLIDAFSRDGVVFEPLGDFASRWRAEHPFRDAAA